MVKFWFIVFAGVLLTSCSEQVNSVVNVPNATQVQETLPPKTAEAPTRVPDVVYVPTPPEVVNKMLELGEVGKDDILYDLGSGDGRIPIAAAKRFGTKGVGIDIDPERIEEANQNAKKAGVSDKVKFMQQDLFKSDFSKATVVTLYLLPELNLKLRSQLFEQLKPGTRVVSHAFDMGDWRPEKTANVNGRYVYSWTIPKEVPNYLRNSPNK